MTKLTEGQSKQILGVSGSNTYTGSIRADEFLTELKGKRAIRKFQEMRDNSAIVGATMYATEQILRDVEICVEPAKLPGQKEPTPEAIKEAAFVESVLDDMEHSLDDHISEALGSLTFGFQIHEVVWKRRQGNTVSPKTKSKYTDGRFGVRKLASRAPWTIQEFEVDKDSGDITGFKQENTWGKPSVVIPMEKCLYYRTTSLNNDPSGRSILRNAYTSYTYLNRLQEIEAIAIERELHGIPIGRIPSEYLASTASDDQVAVRSSFETVLRDLKRNEQGYALLPSDLYTDGDGNPTKERLMDIELITSNGTRSIEIAPAISRYQHDIARSIMAEFLMLGGNATGSYALSKSKSDLFLRSLESYINSIVDVLNTQLVARLWEINGLPPETMPKLVAGDVAPHDLKELGSFLRNLNGANIDLSQEVEVINELLESADLPEIDGEEYLARKEEQKAYDREMADKQIQAKEPGDSNANAGSNPKGRRVPTDGVGLGVGDK